ncbi:MULTISPECIES: hypothetical protein [unclassified Amycolatopsis]|uniref:hypothetical protein n=1 Tax=unclassified Amycolatopsis TaxID=2618356 RepID=UPI001C6A1018|nr:hypothetical protein [Amycolatopsis sp. DSM 110486]QYN18543.1 hypothetical protein K1T34_38245 [Amycolatopsis sp. DSM 110486]
MRPKVFMRGRAVASFSGKSGRRRFEIPSLDREPGPDVRDISMVGTQPEAGKLAELRAAHSRAMPA